MHPPCAATHPYQAALFCYLPEGHGDAHQARLTDWATVCWARWLVSA